MFIKKEIIKRGTEIWSSYVFPNKRITYERDYVDYKITNRLTGSETIKRKYLN